MAFTDYGDIIGRLEADSREAGTFDRVPFDRVDYRLGRVEGDRKAIELINEHREAGRGRADMVYKLARRIHYVMAPTMTLRQKGFVESLGYAIMQLSDDQPVGESDREESCG